MSEKLEKNCEEIRKIREKLEKEIEKKLVTREI